MEKAQKKRRESETAKSHLWELFESKTKSICPQQQWQQRGDKQRVDGTEVKATGRINANVRMKLSRNSSLLVCLFVGLTLRGTV